MIELIIPVAIALIVGIIFGAVGTIYYMKRKAKKKMQNMFNGMEVDD